MNQKNTLIYVEGIKYSRINSDVILKTKTKKFSTVNYNLTLGLEKTTPFDGFLYENKTQESANENERRKYCLTPVKLSLEEDGQEGRFLFPMQSFLRPVSRPIYSAKCVSEEAGWLYTGIS